MKFVTVQDSKDPEFEKWLAVDISTTKPKKRNKKAS